MNKLGDGILSGGGVKGMGTICAGMGAICGGVGTMREQCGGIPGIARGPPIYDLLILRLV